MQEAPVILPSTYLTKIYLFKSVYFIYLSTHIDLCLVKTKKRKVRTRILLFARRMDSLNL